MDAETRTRPFPTNPGEFEGDERISFSKLDNKYIAVRSDGAEFQFDAALKRWIPVADDHDDALIAQFQRHYGAQPDGDDDNQHSEPARGKKRKKEANDGEDGPGRAKASNKRSQGPKPNSAIYVTGLPLDATAEEVAELFSRKCGVIAEEIDSGRPRIKLYMDAQGRFKGDALVVFFKPQSVDMAIMLLDDTDFRLSPSGLGTGKMRVMAADASYKKTNYDVGEAASTAITTGSGGNGHGPVGLPKRNDQTKAKIIKKTLKMSAKLADWDDDDEPAALNPAAKKGTASKWDKVVILRHMFTLAELEEDPAALLDIKDDIREECAKLGTVTNVVLFDGEEEGIVSVRFQTAEAAEACVHSMHGRAFAGRTVEAFFATGREKFKKTKGNEGGQAASDED